MSIDYLKLYELLQPLESDQQFYMTELLRCGILYHQEYYHGTKESEAKDTLAKAMLVFLLHIAGTKEAPIEGELIERLYAQYLFTDTVNAAEVIRLSPEEFLRLKEKIRERE